MFRRVRRRVQARSGDQDIEVEIEHGHAARAGAPPLLDRAPALGTTAAQRVPAEGAAPTLESGSTYFLVVLRDVAQPITRCLFVAP